MQTINKISNSEKRSILSTFDGCSINLLVNQKQLFDTTDDLILFAKNDALYIESSNLLTKRSDSTRLIIFYKNAKSVIHDGKDIILTTLNNVKIVISLKNPNISRIAV